MKNSPLNIFVKALSLLLLLTTSVFASAQYTDHVAETEMLTELVNSNPENGHRALVENIDAFSAILARRSARKKPAAQNNQPAEEDAGPFAKRDAFREYITVTTGPNALNFPPSVSPVPFDTVETISTSSHNKLSLASPGVMIGNSGTYLVMYSMNGDFSNAGGTGLLTPNISALYPSVSPPSALTNGQGVIGPINTETGNNVGASLNQLEGSGVSNSFLADFSAGDCLELQLNNSSATDSISAAVAGFPSSVTGPVFTMSVVRVY